MLLPPPSNRDSRLLQWSLAVSEAVKRTLLPTDRRIINLIGSWHSQLIEILGAMGLREVHRLRGELGRVMFIEDLERDNLGPIFGKRICSLKESLE
jgi:hypothetical protein